MKWADIITLTGATFKASEALWVVPIQVPIGADICNSTIEKVIITAKRPEVSLKRYTEVPKTREYNDVGSLQQLPKFTVSTGKLCYGFPYNRCVV